MDHKIVVPTVQLSLLSLHESCHLEIFKFLNLQDCIGLAGSCSHLRSVANKIAKKSTFRLDSSVADRGEVYIDHVFSSIGQHVSSLIVGCSGVTLSNLCQILHKISNCKNLKCLRIYCWNEWTSKTDSVVYNFDNVELLALKACNPEFTANFLKNFNSLKALYITYCPIGNAKLKPILGKNPNIESFVYWDLDSLFKGKLLELIPMVERLALDVNFGQISELNSLMKLDRLTKLQLNCDDTNINSILQKLARKGIMEEMHLIDVEADDDFFDILTSFDKLQLLVIESIDEKQIMSSITWPMNLKQLLLKFFKMTHNDLSAMIQQLKSMEIIDIGDCSLYGDNMKGDKTSDVTELSQKIRQITDNSDRRHRLDVVLPWHVKLPDKDDSKYHFIDAERLRILCRSDNYQQEIKIYFPGSDSSF